MRWLAIAALILLPVAAEAGALKVVISAVESPLFEQPTEDSRVREVLLLGYRLNGFAHSDIVWQTVDGDLSPGGSSYSLELNYLPQPRYAVGLKIARLQQKLALSCTDSSNADIEVNCDLTAGAM